MEEPQTQTHNLPFPRRKWPPLHLAVPPKMGLPFAWVSLQGRVVGLPEATAARTVGLGGEGAVAWELLSPLHRVLAVAVAAAAAVGSEKDREISRLKRSVELRDQVLLSMQQKLDDLCENMYPLNDQSETDSDCWGSDGKYIEEGLNPEEFQFCSDDFHAPEMGIGITHDSLYAIVDDMEKGAIGGISSAKEIFKTIHVSATEQEERRMSDLSDFFSSSTSSLDIQMSMLAEKKDYYNVRKECEEKDATIKELTAAILASNVAESKRITELEDIIKRKSLVITKLRKDILFLEQKVVQLMRVWRPSFVKSDSNRVQLPLMSSNILYDMSSSSTSSSDSDCPQSSKIHSHEDASVSLRTDNFCLTEDLLSEAASSNRPLDRSLKHSRVTVKQNHFGTNMPKYSAAFKSKPRISSERNTKRILNRDHQKPIRQTSQKKWT